MNSSVLVAGWPFAVLLMLYAQFANRTLRSGVVEDRDVGNKLLILVRDGTASPIHIDGATTICGVDGYPVPFEDIRIGDYVEIFR